MINELKILENELGFIPVYQTEQGNKVVYGRDLYRGLEITDRFSRWFERMLIYGFEEDVDYTSVKSSTVVNNGAVRELDDYILKLDMAKEIAMLQRNYKGREYRKYFIKIEEKYKEMIATPSYMIEDPIARAKAWIIEQEERQALENKVSEMQVRVDYLDKIQGYGNAITTKTIAVDYGMSSVAFNKLLHELHIQYKQGKVWYLYQEHKGNGYEVVTYYKDKPQMKWTLKGAEWLYHILKENGYLPILEK